MTNIISRYLSPLLVIIFIAVPWNSAHSVGYGLCERNTDRSVSLAANFENRCTALNGEACAYHDLRRLELAGHTLFEQSGTTFHQLTFPSQMHLWAVLSLDLDEDDSACWHGGAVVGRNPISMTWGTPSGTKHQKNNFLQIEGGRIIVKNVRIHNTHDAFLKPSRDGSLEVVTSWVSWNRDDLFEGYLNNLKISNSLIDSTYNFLSDPDGTCDAEKDSSASVIVIENSLIRISRMPGPYGGHTNLWHQESAGGHHRLWKLDSCDWNQWPRFILRNNVFYIEGPRTSKFALNDPRCELALPGSCDEPGLPNLLDCSNNLFIYEDYHHWTANNVEPGPVPVSESRFYNPDNPDYTPNGRDCYQKLTDQSPQTKRNLRNVWSRLADKWINANSTQFNLQPIPGIDFVPIPQERKIRIANEFSGKCLHATNQGTIRQRKCSSSNKQYFTVVSDSGGLFRGGFVLHDYRGDPVQLTIGNDGMSQVGSIARSSDIPVMADHWYALPIQNTDLYAIETEAFQKSFLYASSRDFTVNFQSFFEKGIDTLYPQLTGTNSSDQLRWKISASECDGLQDTTLVVNTSDTTEYGWKWGTGKNRNAVVACFYNADTDLNLDVTGYDIDRADEVEVVLNGISIGYLSSGPNNGLNESDTFVIPLTEQIYGLNELRFVQRKSGLKWGVSNIRVDMISR